MGFQKDRRVLLFPVVVQHEVPGFPLPPIQYLLQFGGDDCRGAFLSGGVAEFPEKGFPDIFFVTAASTQENEQWKSQEKTKPDIFHFYVFRLRRENFMPETGSASPERKGRIILYFYRIAKKPWDYHINE